MSVTFSSAKTGLVAIAGHVGCGHCHSLNNQSQDDSVGLAVVLSLLKEATSLSLLIKNFTFSDNKVTAVLENGGVGTGEAKRGISKHEKNIILNMIGKEAIKTHTVVLEQFGRFYGQGVTETPVAVQTAIANAALDGFLKNYPEKFVYTPESYAKNCGKIVGTVLNIDGIDVSVLGTVNATIGGIGPNEDLEGNSDIGCKGEIINILNMHNIPTLIIEAMIHSSFSSGLTKNTYFVRGDQDDDNPYVINAVLEACEKLKYPIKYHQGGMKRTPDALRNNTKMVGKKIVDLGEKLICAETSHDKVNIIAELACVVSQDCGGISFMSNSIHEQIGGAGMLKKTSAVINLVTTDEYAKDNIIPFLTDKELIEYTNIAKETVKALIPKIEESTKHIQVDK